jgi:hypothetical protein
MIVAVHNPSTTKLDSISFRVPHGHFKVSSYLNGSFYSAPADVICQPECTLFTKHETMPASVSFVRLELDQTSDLEVPLKTVALSSHVQIQSEKLAIRYLPGYAKDGVYFNVTSATETLVLGLDLRVYESTNWASKTADISSVYIFSPKSAESEPYSKFTALSVIRGRSEE